MTTIIADRAEQAIREDRTVVHAWSDAEIDDLKHRTIGAIQVMASALRAHGCGIDVGRVVLDVMQLAGVAACYRERAFRAEEIAKEPTRRTQT